jgi:glycosyltransferase involved in cell wall biosynthesis
LGDGPERQKLENLVDNLNLKNEVKFFGFVPYDDLPVYLNSADIFVRPSRSEGMGNSFIEALAAGLPIIGTPVGGITDIIEDGKTGLFAKVDDDKDLAQKIQLLLRDDNLSQSIVYEGRRMIEDKFSWNVLAAKYGDIFEKYAKTPPFKILIATPIYPPQIGGPALYAKNFEREFRASGHEVFVADFGQFLKYPSGIRHLFYFFRVFKDMSRSDIILALDSFSAGLPAALASFLLKKPLILRLEGDFLWEHYSCRFLLKTSAYAA